MIAPSATMHEYRRVFASAIAASGNSKAPGTGTTVTASRPTPARSSSSSARVKSSPVSPPLKRPTTTPTDRRPPLGSPWMTPYPSGIFSSPAEWSGGRSRGSSSSSAGSSSASSAGSASAAGGSSSSSSTGGSSSSTTDPSWEGHGPSSSSGSAS